MLYLTGSRFNLLKRGSVTMSPTASSVAPLANLYDGYPSCPAIFGSNTADPYNIVDINEVTNSGFETGTPGAAPPSWDPGAGTTITNTAGEFDTGAQGCKMDAAAGPGGRTSIYQVIEVPAGEYRQAFARVKNGGSGVGKFSIYNRRTAKYWSGSAWVSAETFVTMSALSSSFEDRSVTYQVEDFDTCRADTVSLLVGIFCTAGVIFVDRVVQVAGANFFGVFGHNLGGGVTPSVNYSDDNAIFTATSPAPVVARPSFYSSFTMAYHRYWHVPYFTGTNFETIYLGEVVLGQYETCTTSPKWGLAKTRTFPGVRNTSPGRRTTALNFSTDPTQDITLEFSARSSTAEKELCESLWLRSGQGRYPVVLAPIDTESDVFHGRILEPITTSRPFSGVYDTSMTLLGDPFPTVGA